VPGWAGWVERLRAEEPTALAVVLQGSFARGDPGPFSDVDLRIVTAGPPRLRDRAYLEEMEAPPGVADLVATGRLAAFLRQLRQAPSDSRPCGPGCETVGRPGERD
jgi:predicted nucleotidyltransferase